MLHGQDSFNVQDRQLARADDDLWIDACPMSLNVAQKGNQASMVLRMSAGWDQKVLTMFS